jgi:DNA polymerase-1
MLRTLVLILLGKVKPKKSITFALKGMGIPAVDITNSGWPSVNAESLRTLAGDPAKEKWGSIFRFFKNEEEGKEACRAVDALLEAGKTSTLLTTFIIPLQELVDSNGRIHTSINVNTETGRLSSRKPNLQNQPALEKDKYKIRDAFICDPGNSLIVADYGQLELRLLAHITNCKSMIDSFYKGGDFHSRTAMSMYTEVAEAVERGDVLLEWDHSKGKPPAPLLKVRLLNFH